MSKPQVITLGCRLNAFESEVMRIHAEASGHGDMVIINTCAVTSEAERQAGQTIRRLRRERPNAEIIVTGCAAQIAPEKFAAMAEVDRVLGNTEKLKAENFATGRAGERVSVSDIMAEDSVTAAPITGFETRSRAFVQIQQGCDHRCTFCIIPFGRGNSRSVPLKAIIEQTRLLVEAGYHEAVLTGVDISSYGPDLADGLGLAGMIRKLLGAVPGLDRLRLSSLDPAAIDDDLIGLAATEPRLMPHFHLSIQAGNDLILKRMARRHSRADVLEICRRLKEARAGAVFGADMIAGFPTETEAMFTETLDLVEEAGLTYLHVFPYSPRLGTPASKMPQVEPAERRRRAARLRQAGETMKTEYFNSLIGTRAMVLAERDRRGYTEHFAPVRMDLGPNAAMPAQGAVVPVSITGLIDMVLTAEPMTGTPA